MATFKLKITASNKVFFDGEAKSITVPLVDGLKSFLAHHENVVYPIEAGEMKIVDSNDKVIDAFVGSGFIEFIDNSASLLCISAELPEEIDVRRANEAKLRAEEQLRQERSIMEYYNSQASLARAMERLKIKNRHSI